MKTKLFFLTTIFSLINCHSALAATPTTVTVNFSATIIAELCQVDASSSTLTYNFHTVTAYTGAHDGDNVAASPIKNDIILECASDPTGKLKISFSSPSSKLEGTSILPLQNGTTDSGMGVKLYNTKDASGTALTLTSGTSTPIQNGSWNTNGQYSFPIAAQLVYDSNVANMKAGNVTASLVLNETSA